MNLSSALSVAAALFCCALALAVVIRNHLTIASASFGVGMLLFAAESVLTGLSFAAASAEEVAFWQTLKLIVKALLPAPWLCFTLTYSRGNYREFLARSRYLLIPAFLFPVLLLPVFGTPSIQIVSSDQGSWLQFGPAAKVLNALILIWTVLILMNIERTFRSAVGTMRWRIKFLVLGLGVVFGARVYLRSQDLLFSGESLALAGLEPAALLIGCTLMTLAYARSNFTDLDVYPSRAALHTSLTAVVAGGYLFLVGVIAHIVARMGGSQNFQFYAFAILLAIVLLGVLLISERFRQNVHNLVSRHFKRPRYDSRNIWSRLTQCISSSTADEAELCDATAKVISSTFNVLSVTIWLYDESKNALVFGASTSTPRSELVQVISSSDLRALRQLSKPFNLEKAKQSWAEVLKQISFTQFRKGGDCIVIPLAAGDRWLGLIILADRVSGVEYIFEEYELLKCIGDQIATSLLNLRLAAELTLGKEREAFQNISAFFIHDLKNTASTLNLMLQNLPVHFDDPAFRKDALQGIGKTAERINHLIARLSALRSKLELNPVECDLNQLVTEALTGLNGVSEVELVKELNTLPKLFADREQLHSVIMNVLLNARDAVGSRGQIVVRTDQGDGCASLSITDNGCGMSRAFVQNSLFRPFQTTKAKGLGIGMFQSKIIIEAHRGNIEVKSELGSGTTFRITLPLSSN